MPPKKSQKTAAKLRCEGYNRAGTGLFEPRAVVISPEAVVISPEVIRKEASSCLSDILDEVEERVDIDECWIQHVTLEGSQRTVRSKA
jgi:hypothetical protein